MNILFRKPLLTCKRLAFLVFPLLTFSLIAFQSCILEDMSECSEYDVVIKIVDVNGNEITADAIDTVGVYLFGQDGFERMISTGKNSDFIFHYIAKTRLTFGFEKNSPLTLVAWGNLNRDNLMVPTLTRGQSLEQSKIGLCKYGDYNQLTTDLFYATCNTNNTASLTEATDASAKDTLTLYMNRIVGAMKVTCKSMDECFGSDTEPFRLVARSTTNALNFMGNPAGETASYCPGLTKNTGGDYATPAFNLLPTSAGEPMTIEIYRRNQLLYSKSTDSKGTELRVKANEQLNVTIDFGAYGNMTVTVTPWGDTAQDVGL